MARKIDILYRTRKASAPLVEQNFPLHIKAYSTQNYKSFLSLWLLQLVTPNSLGFG